MSGGMLNPTIPTYSGRDTVFKVRSTEMNGMKDRYGLEVCK